MLFMQSGPISAAQHSKNLTQIPLSRESVLVVLMTTSVLLVQFPRLWSQCASKSRLSVTWKETFTEFMKKLVTKVLMELCNENTLLMSLMLRNIA